MFIDQAEIYVHGGKGGNGCMSFRREKFMPKGGPDGGDGGDCGSVFLRANVHVETLLDLTGHHHWSAGNGQPGMGRNCSGKKGDDITIDLPGGTLIYDRDTGILLKDLSEYDQALCIAQGGKGGRGNARFARPAHQTPREFEEGTPGQERWLRLELKLIADVVLVGLPNAGKSTLLSRLSKAKPKIADYPFTTLQPQLGIVELSDHRRLVLADIPGLIEGAHEGAGLGDTFLRHIERTRVILHVVDVGNEYAPLPPTIAYQTIRNELAKYSPILAAKEELIAANKIDLTGGNEAAEQFAQEIGKPVIPISGVSGAGLAALKEKLWTLARQAAPLPHPMEFLPPSGERN